MGRTRYAALAALALVLAVTSCSPRSHHRSGVKEQFVNSADQICADHLSAVLDWLGQPRTGSSYRRLATQDEGIFRIMSASIGRLEQLGPAPGPAGDAFGGYVKTLKARASLYRLAGVAELHRDALFAAQMQRRVDQIDTLGDGYAHSYGLRICGIGARDATKGLGA
jgi:hypothetical protein